MPLRDDFPLIERRPPERRRREKKYIVLYSCCCCCCCCLHTVGGTIGAMMGSRSDRRVDSPDGPPRPHASQGLYWGSLVIAVALGTAAIIALQYMDPSPYKAPVSNGLVFSGLSLILAGPLWLLAGCLIMAVRVALLPRELRGVYWGQLGRILLGTFAGTFAGIGVMWVIAIALNGF